MKTEKEQIKELIVIMGYILDSIDVRVAQARHFEAKETAIRLLRKLMDEITKQRTDLTP